MSSTHLSTWQHKASHHHDEQQRERPHSIGNHQISGKSSDGSEESDCHVVHQEQDQPVHKEPATQQILSAANVVVTATSGVREMTARVCIMTTIIKCTASHAAQLLKYKWSSSQ